MEARINQKKLAERVKELSCLYAIARVAQAHDEQLTTFLERVVEVIPQGWQFPESALVHLQLDDKEFGTVVTDGHAMLASLVVEQHVRGTITVAYPDARIAADEPLFLEEEQQLLDKIAVDISLFIDRQERREQQALLETRMRSNDRLTILAEITAGIAHELNTPLGNVLGFAELLKKEEVDRERRSDLQRIIDSALIGREIVKKLMYFSCEMPAHFQLADANKALRDSAHLLAHRLDQQQISIVWKLSESPPMLRLDQVQFAQVVSNLLLNAAAAMPEGGTISISTDHIGNGATITITDTGTGIHPDHLKKIFQPFFTTKPTGEGTGLGLAVVHGIIKGHGGNVSVSSIVGEGTMFTLSFPAPNP
ncbi:MAG: sensor histidine kinase [Flavobacteriales bacterium]|nr:sensor histidine kinase [Flavobacteriales bacterium]